MGSKRVNSDSSNPEVPAVVEDKGRRKSRAVATERLNASDSAGKKVVYVCVVGLNAGWVYVLFFFVL